LQKKDTDWPDLFGTVQFVGIHLLALPDADIAPAVIELFVAILAILLRGFCFLNHFGNLPEAVIERGGILRPPFSYSENVVGRTRTCSVEDAVNGCSPYHVFIAGLAGALTQTTSFNSQECLC
jgi:hypothetical protein